MSSTTQQQPIVRNMPIASAGDAHAHFAAQLSFETDCADVNHDLQLPDRGFVLVDARSDAHYAAGHLPSAISLPHARIGADTTAHLPRDVTLVTYCWGTHCNGATRAAMKLAGLGFRVKEMIGGYEAWQREGYAIERTERMERHAIVTQVPSF
jgi:rhodanese-related sulfurtransferase